MARLTPKAVDLKTTEMEIVYDDDATEVWDDTEDEALWEHNDITEKQNESPD